VNGATSSVLDLHARDTSGMALEVKLLFVVSVLISCQYKAMLKNWNYKPYTYQHIPEDDRRVPVRVVQRIYQHVRCLSWETHQRRKGNTST